MRLPYAEVECESTGVVHEEAQLRAAATLVAAPEITDVLLLVHGWNNDMPAARRLFEHLADNVANVQDGVADWRARRIAVIGVLWPSVRWADRDDLAGGGLSTGDEATHLLAAIDDTIEDADIRQRLRELTPRLDRSATARGEFVDTLRLLLPEPADDDEDAPPTALVKGDAEQLFQDAGGPDIDFGTDDRSGGAASMDATALNGGGAAGFGLGGFLRGARNLLNLTSYYTMKNRAGDVGSNGVARLVAELHAANGAARYHLAGHSFGARVVAAAAAATEPAIHSLTLLQGAFSHYGFAQDFDNRRHDGAFRNVLTTQRLTGPLLVTHTRNDLAVGLAYAIASRLARQAGAGLGGPDDRYGGIGRNGALKTPEVALPLGALRNTGGPYAFAPNKVYNLRSDAHIRHHGDVTNRQVAYALLAAMCSPSR